MEARQRERQNQLRDQAAQGSVLDKVKQVSLHLEFSLLIFSRVLSIEMHSCPYNRRWVSQPRC